MRISDWSSDVCSSDLIEGATGGDRNFGPAFDYAALRKRFRNTWIANNGYTLEMAEAALAGKQADLIAFGRPFIANPDLVEIGRASGRERVCQYVEIAVVAGRFKKKLDSTHK